MSEGDEEGGVIIRPWRNVDSNEKLLICNGPPKVFVRERVHVSQLELEIIDVAHWKLVTPQLIELRIVRLYLHVMIMHTSMAELAHLFVMH